MKEDEFNSYIYGYANVQQYKTDVAFKTLVEGVKDNLYIIPDFQRVYKWTEAQVENLAVSLIRGMPIPPIYAYRNEMNQLEILDGQQRVISMVLYYMGKYTEKTRNNYIDLKNDNTPNASLFDGLKRTKLKDKKYEMKYYEIIDGEEIEKNIDITYEKLPINIRRKLDYTTITVIEISIENKELRNRYLYKIFANLNSGGTTLTAQELRNGIYRCEFYKMLSEVNEYNERWKELFGDVTDSSINIERLLIFSAFKYYIKFEDDKFTIDNYTNMNKLLNDFSEEAVKFNDDKINEYRKDIEIFISLLKGKISKQLLKTALLEILFTVTNKTNCQVSITAEFYDNISKNNEYSKTIKTGNRTKSAIESKLEAVYNEIRKFIE